MSRQTDRRLVEPKCKAKGSMFSVQALVARLSAYPTPKNRQPDSFTVAVRGAAVWGLAIFLSLSFFFFLTRSGGSVGLSVDTRRDSKC